MYTSLSLLTLFGAKAYGWGTLGHETIAFVASNFVKSDTQAWAQNILGDHSSTYLANVSTWADSFRYTTEGKFSSSFHYIDAEDDPPSACNVDFERDCGEEGCVVSAIANYTQRVQQAGVLSDREVNYALRFVVHFLGDITQPLHVENLALGGNDIDVTFDGEDSNLHSVWDTGIPNEIRQVDSVSLSDAQAWAADLTTAIKSGKYKSSAQSWIEGDDISDAKNSALTWASDSNSYVCSVVLPDGVDAVETTDLAGAYFNKSVETVELQIAKGGFRLANWLDQLAAAQSNNSTYKRSAVDLSGRDLLPKPRELSKAKLARRAVGWDCAHPH